MHRATTSNRQGFDARLAAIDFEENIRRYALSRTAPEFHRVWRLKTGGQFRISNYAIDFIDLCWIGLRRLSRLWGEGSRPICLRPWQRICYLDRGLIALEISGGQIPNNCLSETECRYGCAFRRGSVRFEHKTIKANLIPCLPAHPRTPQELSTRHPVHTGSTQHVVLRGRKQLRELPGRNNLGLAGGEGLNATSKERRPVRRNDFEESYSFASCSDNSSERTLAHVLPHLSVWRQSSLNRVDRIDHNASVAGSGAKPRRQFRAGTHASDHARTLTRD